MDEDERKRRVELLTELHRPLEDHWGVATKIGLDPKMSDYTFKHHLTRLQLIYTGQEVDPNLRRYRPVEKIIPNTAPVTHLYGVKGLLSSNTPEMQERKRDKERAWNNRLYTMEAIKVNVDDDFGGYREERRTPKLMESNQGQEDNLDISRNKEETSRRSRSTSRSPSRERFHSPSNIRSLTPPSSGTRNAPSLNTRTGRSSPSGIRGDDAQHSNIYIRSRYEGEDLPRTDYMVLGMYKLNLEQQEVYNSFVEMISHFDEFDRKNIIQDAIADSQASTSLDSFGGIKLRR